METNLKLSPNLFAGEHHSVMPLIKYTAHFSSMDFDRMTFGNVLADDILHGDNLRQKSDVLFPCEDTSSVYVASVLDTGRPHRTSHPSHTRTTSFVSSNPPIISTWFDDSPTRSAFTIDDDKMSVLSWDNKTQQWFNEEGVAYPTFPDCEYDRTSMFTFGPSSDINSTASMESHDSHTMVSTIDDFQKTSSAKHDPFDCMDEQLLLSPLESFAELCWESAVVPEQPKLRSVNSAAELRLSKLYDDAAQQYEEAHIRESLHLAEVSLPHMRFNEDSFQGLKMASKEVAPWLYVSERATSMLDLPRDSSIPQPSGTPSRGVQQRHHRAKASLSSITKFPFSFHFPGRKKE